MNQYSCQVGITDRGRLILILLDSVPCQDFQDHQDHPSQSQETQDAPHFQNS